MAEANIESANIRGRGSGAEATAVSGVILTFAEGKVIRFEDFGDRNKALEPAGLSEREAEPGS